ncbi:MAG: hypothetical protein AMXMBFR84_48320 [Candidatus Hydrogenedentota bacterium]
MRITLETVRNVLRNALGRESFAGSFIKRVEESPECPTACITADGHLRYGPAFVSRYVTSEEDLFCLVMHELMHPMFGHFVHGPGELENLAADMVINASISQLFARASGEGSLFKKFYEPHGLPGLLRPMSLMRDSRYDVLYDVFYCYGRRSGQWLSTGEVIQTLKVLTPTSEAAAITLLGSHATGTNTKLGPDSGVEGLSAEDLGRIAEDLKKAVKRNLGPNAGYSQNLLDMFVDALKTHLSIKKALLQKFATRQKMDNFRQTTRHSRVCVSPIPIHPSKRDLVLLSAGITPFHYRNRTTGVTSHKQGLAVYLDVSGSVNEHLPGIIGVLQSLRTELTSVFLFSNIVVEIPFHTLLQGAVKTTYGTDFNCIANSIIERGLDKAVVLTDGYAGLKPEQLEELRRRKVRTMTVLFGGKQDCPEFQPLGDVVQLEDIVH